MRGSDCCYFLTAVPTVDVPTASSYDVELEKTCRNLNCTFCKFKIALSFWKDKQTRPRLLVVANFITCLPTEIPRRDIAFIPSSDARAKDGGYREQGLLWWPFLLVMYWYCYEENRCWPLLRPIGLRFACAWWTRGLIPPFPSSSNC